MVIRVHREMGVINPIRHIRDNIKFVIEYNIKPWEVTGDCRDIFGSEYNIKNGGIEQEGFTEVNEWDIQDIIISFTDSELGWCE